MSQNDAFARNSDPETSHLAAASIDVTHLERLVGECIAASGDRGRTWDEIAAETGIDKASVSPRFAPLRRKNVIKAKIAPDTGRSVKRCGNSSRGQMVWVAA